MEDDSEKSPEQTETKPSVTVEFIKHPTAGLIKQVRGGDGKFKRQKGALVSPKQRREVLQNFLSQPEVGPDGKMRRGDKSIHRRLIENMARIAMDPGEQPVFDKLGELVRNEDGTPLMVKDSKLRMAAVQAWKELMLRADGKYSTSMEDLEAQKMQGVKIVVITPPPEMVNREVIEDRPREKLEPKFIEGEIVENK